MELQHLPHSIKSKDEYGRILGEIVFPEKTGEGHYTIESTYVAEEYLGTDLGDRLVREAVKQIHEQGGVVEEAECPFARKWLHAHGVRR